MIATYVQRYARIPDNLQAQARDSAERALAVRAAIEAAGVTLPPLRDLSQVEDPGEILIVEEDDEGDG